MRAAGVGVGFDAMLDSDTESQNTKRHERPDDWRLKLVGEVLGKSLGPGEFPEDAKRHVQKESEILAAKITRSLNPPWTSLQTFREFFQQE